MEKRDMQQGQNQKEILVQLGYSVFNLRMVGAETGAPEETCTAVIMYIEDKYICTHVAEKT